MSETIQFTGTREEFLAKAREMMTEESVERALTAWYGGAWPAMSHEEAVGMRADMADALDAALQTPHKTKTPE